MALNDAERTVKGDLRTVETPECTRLVEAVGAQWGTVEVLETVVAYKLIQYCSQERDPGLHLRLEQAVIELRSWQNVE